MKAYRVTHKQTDRHTDIQTDRQADLQTQMHTKTQRPGQGETRRTFLTNVQLKCVLLCIASSYLS